VGGLGELAVGLGVTNIPPVRCCSTAPALVCSTSILALASRYSVLDAREALVSQALVRKPYRCAYSVENELVQIPQRSLGPAGSGGQTWNQLTVSDCVG
jgi:hypothetical protein